MNIRAVVSFKENDALREVINRAGTTLDEVGESAQEKARDNAPYKTGEHRRGIFWLRTGELRGIYGARTAYSAHLELGTKNMPARPHLAPAMQQAIREAQSK